MGAHAINPLAGQQRELSSEKAVRIVDAMRASVAARGATGSTFDHVAREAGVSRGLLHYYFGTKERLLVEVIRREMDLSDERIDKGVANAKSADDVIDAMVGSFRVYLSEGNPLVALFFELLTLAQRNEEIAVELAALSRQIRAHLAEVLQTKHDAGILELRASADSVATFLFATSDGLTARYLTEPDLDMDALISTAVLAARALVS
jgi:AcrR family transcriptional regulator